MPRFDESGSSLGVPGRRARVSAVLVLAGMSGAFAFESRARAGDEASTASTAAPSLPVRPPAAQPGAHVALGLSVGSCTRDDDNVGAAGFCGEVSGGVDLVVALDWHLDFEGGLGIMPKTTAGFSDFGLSQASGGCYGAIRAMVGHDWAPLFFSRLGGQLRITYSNDWLAPGPQLLVDLGTRLPWGIELGLRGDAGSDGVVSNEGGRHKATLTLAYGTQLLARYVFR